MWGHEVNAFSPCGSEMEYWVTGDTAVIRDLRERYTSFELGPYTAVFVQLRGEMGPVLDCGFCETFDGSFNVDEIVEVTYPGPMDCVTEMGGGGENRS